MTVRYERLMQSDNNNRTKVTLRYKATSYKVAPSSLKQVPYKQTLLYLSHLYGRHECEEANGDNGQLYHQVLGDGPTLLA